MKNLLIIETVLGVIVALGHAACGNVPVFLVCAAGAAVSAACGQL